MLKRGFELTDNKEELKNNSEEEAKDSVESVENQESTESVSNEDEMEKLQAELEATEDRYLRLQAELQNMRRRNQKDREEDRKFRSQSLATDLVPVIDNLERALTIEVSDKEGKNLKKGIEMVLESFNNALEKEGIEILNPLNEPFDPQFHEAYTSVPADEKVKAGNVAQVFEKGYTLNGRILRAAKVAVAE